MKNMFISSAALCKSAVGFKTQRKMLVFHLKIVRYKLFQG